MSKLHVDAILAAAHRMAELQAENEQLKERIGDLEQNLRVAESARDDARAEAVTLRDQMRNMQSATEAELDSLYAYARDRLDPDRPRELPVTVFVPGVRSVIDRRLTDLEARVEQLENHPAGCTCTRCRSDDRPAEVAASLDAAIREVRNRIEECECSPKYRELAPGVHAGYCPLKGLPL